MPSRIFDPGSFRKKVLRKSKSVVGGAILLQKGGPGAGSSYPSVADYEHETGQSKCGHGRGQCQAEKSHDQATQKET